MPDQDNAPADVFGVDARVTKQDKKLITLEVDVFTYILGIKVPQPKKRFECEVDEVVEVKEDDMEAKIFKSIATMTKPEKRFCIKSAWGNNTGYALQGKPGTMLADEDLNLIDQYLQWQYMQFNIGVASSCAVKVAAHFGLLSEDGMIALQEVKDMLVQKKVLICPIHCDEPLHWTFLVLWSNEAGQVVDVKYVDWCINMKMNALIAQKLLNMLVLDPMDTTKKLLKLPKAWNSYRQRPESNDCGFGLWWVEETVMKQMRLECDTGAYPKPVEWRKTLCTFATSLQKEQSEWLVEDAKGGKSKVAICIPGEKKVGKEWDHLKMQRKQFFTCSSCRWSQTGEGCCYCNPEKHAKLREDKKRKSRELAEALKKAIGVCVELGLVPELVEEPSAPSAPIGALEGGGGDKADSATWCMIKRYMSPAQWKPLERYEKLHKAEARGIDILCNI